MNPGANRFKQRCNSHESLWDSSDLGVCDQFAEWYKRTKADAANNRVQLNLVTILARINAVLLAANIPQHGIDGFGSYLPLTSKQRFALDRLRDLTAAGHKTIFFATNPGLLDLLARHLQVDGIDTVVYHGKIPVGQRSRALNERFRNGPVPVLLATYGVAQTGLNLYQADRAIFNEYTWLSTTLDQAAHRLLRPQQTNDVVLEHLSIAGSIDDYQRQMTDFKRDAARAGLDWATPELEGEEFLHLDTILGRFIEALASLRGMKGYELRKRLVA